MKSVCIVILFCLVHLTIQGQFEEGFQIDWSEDVELTNSSKTIVGVHEVDRDTLLLIYQQKKSGHSDSRDHLFRWVNANTGELIRKKEYDIYIPGDQFPRHSLIDKEGNIIIVGESQCSNSTHTNDPGRYDFYITKYSPSGNLLWYQCYGTSANDAMAVKVFETADNQYLAFTHISRADGDVSNHLGEVDIWMLWIDAEEGMLRRERTVGGSKDDFVQKVIVKPDSNFSLIIKTNSKDQDFAYLDSNNAENCYVKLEIDIYGELINSMYLLSGDSFVYTYPEEFKFITKLNEEVVVFDLRRSTESFQYSNLYGISNNLSPLLTTFNDMYHNPVGTMFAAGDGMLLFGSNMNTNFNPTFGTNFWGENTSWVTYIELDSGKKWETRLPDELVDRYGNQSLASAVYQIEWRESRYDANVFFGAWGHRSFKLTPKPSTSISTEHSTVASFSAYPNPNNTGVLNSNLKANYSLLDLQGRSIKTFKESTVLDVSDVQSGSYLLKHESGATLRLVLE